MSTANIKDAEKKYELKLKKDDYELTISEILDKNCIEKDGVIFLIYNDEPIHILDYYYNDDGVVEFYKNICDIPIKKLKEYGYKIEDEIIISIYSGGMGSSGGFDFISLYNEIEFFAANHPITLTLVGVSIKIAFGSLKKIFDKKKEECNPDSFQKALYHNKEYTEDDIIYQFRLNEIDDDYENQKAAVEIILEFYGFEYNKKKNKWIIKEEKMRK